MITFYDEQPVDWLLRIYRTSMAQPDIRLRKPTLFQHKGLKSSFDISQDNKLKDRFFEAGEKRWHSDDPSGKVFTNMVPFGENIPDLAYASGSGFFWAKDPQVGQYYGVVLDSNEAVKRIYVETGTNAHPTDTLKEGKLEVGFAKDSAQQVDKLSECANWASIGEILAGRVEVENVMTFTRNRSIRCFRVTITKPQQDWVALKQIAVFLRDKESHI